MNLFELARSDAYGYMHLAGPPYCNSARQAQYLCSRSRLFPGSESTNKVPVVITFKIYRLSAHLFLTTIVLCICYGVQKSRLVDHDVSLRGLVFIVLVTLLIIPYFICLHADAADALMVTYLAEEHLVEMDPLYVDKAPRVQPDCYLGAKERSRDHCQVEAISYIWLICILGFSLENTHF